MIIFTVCKMKNKIAVIGAGAIGSIIGGLLAKAGEDVTLIGRKAHVDVINKNGLAVDGVFGKMNIRVKAAERLIFKPDLVLLAVKTQDVQEAVREIKPLISQSLIVTMQNGVRSDNLVAEILGKENIISCVVLHGGTFLEPGKVTFSNYSKQGSLLIGEPFNYKNERLKNLADLLSKALPTVIVKDVHSAHWTKLIANLNNAIPAITGLSMQEMSKYPELRKLSVLLMREGLQILEKADIKPSYLPGVPISIVRMLLAAPTWIGSQALRLISLSLGNVPVPGSTLQSIKRGKTTEIDYLNGEIVALGKKLDIPTPYNTGIIKIVHQVEKTGRFIKAEKALNSVESANY